MRLGELTTLLPQLADFYPHPNASAAFLEAALDTSGQAIHMMKG